MLICVGLAYQCEVVDDEVVDAFLDVAEIVVLGDAVEHDGRVDGDVAEVVDAHLDDGAHAQLSLIHI